MTNAHATRNEVRVKKEHKINYIKTSKERSGADSGNKMTIEDKNAVM